MNECQLHCWTFGEASVGGPSACERGSDGRRGRRRGELISSRPDSSAHLPRQAGVTIAPQPSVPSAPDQNPDAPEEPAAQAAWRAPPRRPCSDFATTTLLHDHTHTRTQHGLSARTVPSRRAAGPRGSVPALRVAPLRRLWCGARPLSRATRLRADSRHLAGTKGMVACSQPLAAEAGLEILRKGGNAADAGEPLPFLWARALPVVHCEGFDKLLQGRAWPLAPPNDRSTC